MGVTIDFEAPLEDQANAFASGLQALHDAGAQYILAPNAHNFSMLPVVPIEDQSTVEIATQTFNGLYANAIAGLGISVMEADFFGVYNTIAASPATYGIINLTDPCKDSGGLCAEPDSYFFWDTVHPTTVVHRELANELASIISPVPLPPTAPTPVPATAWLFVTVLIGLIGLMGSIGLRRKG
jgi:outer membrane lipase/esterase